MGSGLFILVILGALYLLPMLIAGLRGHHQYGSIAVLNVFLGWTFVGWVIALAMSVSHINEAQRRHH